MSQTIREHSIGGGEPTKVNEDVKLFTDTHLAACRGMKSERYVAYQMASGALQVFDAEAKKRKPRSLSGPPLLTCTLSSTGSC